MPLALVHKLVHGAALRRHEEGRPADAVIEDDLVRVRVGVKAMIRARVVRVRVRVTGLPDESSSVSGWQRAKASDGSAPSRLRLQMKSATARSTPQRSVACTGAAVLPCAFGRIRSSVPRTIGPPERGGAGLVPSLDAVHLTVHPARRTAARRLGGSGPNPSTDASERRSMPYVAIAVSLSKRKRRQEGACWGCKKKTGLTHNFLSEGRSGTQYMSPSLVSTARQLWCSCRVCCSSHCALDELTCAQAATARFLCALCARRRCSCRRCAAMSSSRAASCRAYSAASAALGGTRSAPS